MGELNSFRFTCPSLAILMRLSSLFRSIHAYVIRLGMCPVDLDLTWPGSVPSWKRGRGKIGIEVDICGSIYAFGSTQRSMRTWGVEELGVKSLGRTDCVAELHGDRCFDEFDGGSNACQLWTRLLRIGDCKMMRMTFQQAVDDVVGCG